VEEHLTKDLCCAFCPVEAAVIEYATLVPVMTAPTGTVTVTVVGHAEIDDVVGLANNVVEPATLGPLAEAEVLCETAVME
jgi:hypothetical protein